MMKKFMLAALLVMPAFGLIGCQDAETQSEIANLKNQVASLQDENRRLGAEIDGIRPGDGGEPMDVGTLIVRLEKAERDLAAANARLEDLEKSGGGTGATAEETGDLSETAVDDMVDAALKRREEKERADREARQAERRAEREAGMQAFADRLKEEGIEFDPKNPRESGMQIWMDETKRNKAFGVMREMMDERRLAPLGLDEYQTSEVLRIEKAARDKLKETTARLRETGATPEEIQKETAYINEQKEQDLKNVMNEEQYEKYEEDAAAGGMMPDNLEDLQGLFPGGGMMPGGWGGGNGR